MTERGSRVGALRSGAVGLTILLLLLAGCASARTAKDPATSGSAASTPPAAKVPPALAALGKNGNGYVDLTVQQLADRAAR